MASLQEQQVATTRVVSSSYIAGLFAGFAQTLVGHPFDTVKVESTT